MVECGCVKVNQNDPRVRLFDAPAILMTINCVVRHFVLLISSSSGVLRFIDINSAGQSSNCNIRRRLRPSWVVTDLTPRRTLKRPRCWRQRTPGCPAVRRGPLRRMPGCSNRKSQSHYTVASMWHTDFSRNTLCCHFTDNAHDCVFGCLSHYSVTHSHVLLIGPTVLQQYYYANGFIDYFCLFSGNLVLS